MTSRRVRLSEEELEAIKTTVKSFDEKAKVLIFGSRANPNLRGGDIDILVISDAIDWKTRRKIRVELIKKLGDRKIDLIVASRENLEDPFVKLAIEEGIEI
ncbi:nucleotidyltransferase domain-containing protein [Phorcysia thermohydrogeniphila]|uniref:Nucleotidyltransferase-like protein n=1 Tax=Phorcysia thermohydrogeniphila TaxID=936138 RepID=A0A4R1GLH1_9BACT|nr:nucleotidyltransferase domain-containing protein [Phorcysia thermohydrogeniphila]TCK05202.1 nucleotidyltransferase-like protein [Phorcysia thermohydrogeniphila]